MLQEYNKNEIKFVNIQGYKKDLQENSLNFIKALTFEDNLKKIANLENITLYYSKKSKHKGIKIIKFLKNNNFSIKLKKTEYNFPSFINYLFFKIELINGKKIIAFITPSEKIKTLPEKEKNELNKFDNWSTLFLDLQLLPF